MKRRFLMPLLIAAFGLAIGGACKKKEEGGEAEPAAAKPAEGEAAKEEAKEEPKEEAKEGEGDAKAAGSTGIEECDAYLAAVEKYVSCDKVPEQARAATKQAIEQSKQAWGAMNDKTPPEAKKAAADGCKQGLDALKKGAEAAGCEI